MVLAAIVLSVATVATLGVLHGRDILKTQVKSQLHEAASVAREELDSKILTRFTAMTRAAHELRMSQSRFLAEAPGQIGRDAGLDALFSSIQIFGPRGTIIADYPQDDRVGVNVGGSSYFQAVSNQLTTIISKPFLSRDHRQPTVNVIAPVFSPKGNFIGAIAGSINLGDQGFLGSLQQIHIGAHGYMLVATRNGTLLSGPGSRQLLQKLPHLNSLQFALQGQEGVFEGTNFEHQRSFFAVSQLSQAPWFVAAVRPEAEALTPFVRFTRSAVILSLIVLVIIAPITWWVFDRLLQPLEDLESQILQRHSGQRLMPLSIRGSQELRSVAEVFNSVYDDRTRALATLAQREAFFRSLTESAPLGIVQTDTDGYIQFANRAFCNIIGLHSSALTGRRWLDGLVTEDRDRVDREWNQARNRNHALETECRLGTARRGKVWVDVVAQTIKADGKLLGYIAITRDITHERQIEQRLEQERVRAERVLGVLREAVVVTDRQGIVRYANDPGKQFVGGVEPLLGCSLFDCVRIEVEGHPWDLSAFQSTDDVQNLDVVMYNADNLQLDLELTLLQLNPAQSDDQNLVLVMRDDSERRRQEERLSWEATHDPLTRLLNRRAFMASLVQWLGEARENGKPSALALIDLDHFKPINDEGGHLLGDELLRRLSDILVETVRKSDVVARIGGDEFAVLLPGCSEERAMDILERIRAGIQSLKVRDDHRQYGVTASIGVTLLSANDENPREALTRADEGCYAVKAAGRNAVVLVASPSGAGGRQARV